MSVLVRIVGPSLTDFGVSDVMADPKVELFDGQSRSLARNNDWSGGPELVYAFSLAGAFGLTNASKDAALLVSLTPGNYTLDVRGANGSSGMALVEIYELPWKR